MGSKAKAREKSGLRRLSELRYRLYFKEIRGKTPRLSSKSLLLKEDGETLSECYCPEGAKLVFWKATYRVIST
jgi:hypothetical protein